MTDHSLSPDISRIDLLAASGSLAETEDLGRRLGEQLAPGDLILLYGELGAGKTAFVRGVASGLGIDVDDVSSPTFTLVQEYRGRLWLQHVDLYRVQHAAEVDELGLDEFRARGDVVAIEWAERLSDRPDDAIAVRIADAGGDRREISIARRAATPGAQAKG